MKKKLLLTAFVAALAIGAAFAADLTYTTLPQDTDSALVLANKRASEAASNKYSNIVLAAPTTTAVKATSGILEKIVINSAGHTDSTITVYDNTAASGTKIATITSAAQATLHYGCRFGTGLTIVTAGTSAANITVVYR